MMNQTLFRETFSQLHASEEAKKEIFAMAEKRKMRKTSPLVRAVGLAAVLTIALAVTAGAVNIATGGMLFQVLWSDGKQMELENEQGERVHVTLGEEELFREADGRLLLCMAGEEEDITEALQKTGHFEKVFEVEDPQPDGTAERRTVRVEITGSIDAWTGVWDYGDGVTYTATGGQA